MNPLGFGVGLVFVGRGEADGGVEPNAILDSNDEPLLDSNDEQILDTE